MKTLLQRCGCGKSTEGECAECAATKSKDLQRSPSSGAGGSIAPSIVHEVLRSPGQPLDQSTRAFFAPRFGHDFSAIRVHTGSRAEQSARAVEASAYTVGQDIVFGVGAYAPHSPKGQKLLAHELVHTLQQSDGGAAGIQPASLEVNRPGDAYEQEADQVAERVMAGPGAPQPVQASLRGVARLQRNGDPRYAPSGMTCEIAATPGTTAESTLVGVSGDELDAKKLNKDHKSQVADFYKKWSGGDPQGFIAVEGYASSKGPKDEKTRQAQNWQYSCRRAELVQAELVKLGAARSRVITFAHGETDQFSAAKVEDNRVVVLSTVTVGPKKPPAPPPVNPSVPTRKEIKADTTGEKEKPAKVDVTATKEIPGEPPKADTKEEEPDRWFSLTYAFDIKKDFQFGKANLTPPANAPTPTFLCDHGVVQVGGKVNVGLKLGKYVELFNEPELDFNLAPAFCGNNPGISAQVNALKLNLVKDIMEGDLVYLIGLPDGWATGLLHAPFSTGGQIKIGFTPFARISPDYKNFKINIYGGIGFQQGVLDPNFPNSKVEQRTRGAGTIGAELEIDWDFGPKQKPAKRPEENQ